MNDFRIKIFADGADLAAIRALRDDPLIDGFTTNPTLMRKAGVSDYMAFARAAVEAVPDRPISFEVFSDDFDEMGEQALLLAELGENVYVKVPVTNTVGTSSAPVIQRLVAEGVKVNVTAVMTPAQVESSAELLRDSAAAFLSIFAGRIADTGRDPVPVVRCAVELLESAPGVEVLWASPREILNVVQAADAGCHVITATSDLLAKLPLLGKSLEEFSLETVRMFRSDAVEAGYSIDLRALAWEGTRG